MVAWPLDPVVLNLEKHFLVFITGNFVNSKNSTFALFYIDTCSEAEPKGSDCFEKFAEMNECMSKHPELYENNDEQMSEAAEESVKSTETEQQKQKKES